MYTNQMYTNQMYNDVYNNRYPSYMYTNQMHNDVYNNRYPSHMYTNTGKLNSDINDHLATVMQSVNHILPHSAVSDRLASLLNLSMGDEWPPEWPTEWPLKV